MTKGTRGPEGPATDEGDQGTGDDEGIGTGRCDRFDNVG